MEDPQSLVNGESHAPNDSDASAELPADDLMVQSPTTVTVQPGDAQDNHSLPETIDGTAKEASVHQTSGRSNGSPANAAAKADGITNGTNGVSQLSRKRSRDGTQLPIKPSSLPNKPYEDSDAHKARLLDRYIQRDLEHAAIGIEFEQRRVSYEDYKNKEADRMRDIILPLRRQDPGAVYGRGYAGYGNWSTDARNHIIYTAQRPPPKGRRAPPLRVNRKDTQQQADMLEQLVPIRLDIELEKLRLRDTFTWNLQERNVSPALFTNYLLEDLRIPPEYAPEMAKQIRFEIEDQTHNFYPHLIVEDGALEPGRPYTEYKDDEMRIQIKLHITIGRVTLVDQFEWDINNPLNCPEEFARQMAWENALSGEFTTAIAHSIREQSHQYTKSLWLTNHVFDGRPIEDSEVRDAFMPGPIHSPFRPQQSQKDWMPYMYEMSEAELERTETIMMREHRAQKRQLNRRGGPALPDLRERQRTVRSLFVHTVIPGAVETWEVSGITKTRRAGRGGRRPGARGADEELDSSDLESEEEVPDSPMPASFNALAGTARTRNMRGAASAAQAAMRANYGRSLTPDSQLATPQDSRMGVRPRGLARDESVVDDGDTMIVRLKIGKAKFRHWWDAYRAKKRASEYPLSGYASLPPTLALAAASQSNATPKKDTASSSTPALTPKVLPGRETRSRTPVVANGNTRGGRGVQYDDQGRVEHDRWPNADDVPPPPPDWLQTGVKNMRHRHPDSDFEPLMKAYCISEDDDAIFRPSSPLRPGAPPPEGTKVMYLPRLRCNDCPVKVYTTIPGKVEEDFEVHLKNRVHRERVAERLAKKKRTR